MPTVMISTSTKSLTCDIGLEIRGQANAKASKPANDRNWIGISHVIQPSNADMADKLTQEIIDEGMARAEKGACRPDDDCCDALPDDVTSAHQTCTPKGRCKIGRIVVNSSRDTWHVWLDLHTGEGRLPTS
jgi:hypothetical protein